MSEDYVNRELFAAGHEFGRARLFTMAVARLMKLGLDDQSRTTAQRLLGELQRALEEVILRLGGLDVELSQPASDYDVGHLDEWLEEQGTVVEHDVGRAYGSRARRLFRLGAVAHEAATYRNSLLESERGGRPRDSALFRRLLDTVLENGGLPKNLLDDDPTLEPDKLYDIFTTTISRSDDDLG